MSKIKKVNYGHLNWGPFVLRTIMPDYITKKLLAEGKKAKKTYNHKLAGQLDNQFLYPNNVQQWFYNEIKKSNHVLYIPFLDVCLTVKND